jgi:hypothetical protein
VNFKPTLTKIASLTLLLSSNVYADQLFQPAKGEQLLKAQAKANQLTATKTGVADAFVYRVNANALTNTTKQIDLNLAPGLNISAKMKSVGTSASGGMLWQGTIGGESAKAGQGPSTESVTLVNRKGKITGTVRVDGRLFNIRPMANGLHMVTEIDENNMKPDHPPGAMSQLEAQLKERQANETSLVQTAESSATLADPVIRVLVLYTNGVSSEVSDIPGLIDLAFAETNTGYTNSGVNATVELAHLASINYSSSSISTDLDRIKASSDGYMDEAHTLRATHDADVVMLIVPDSGSSCGKAGAIGAVASTAFAVTAQDCATGYYSFGHELGHLQSARHNPETDSTSTPYAFGHGYRDPSNNWRTVMAYNCSGGCSRINWWSNPNNTRSGTAMGTAATSDNTRVLNLTASTVAGFSNGGTPPPPPTGTVLENGVAATGLSGAASEQQTFTFEVPSNATNVTFTMSGGSGDADLYTRFGSAPTTSTYDCRPYATGNAEECTSAAQTGTYHAMINGYSAYSGVSLLASYTAGGSTGGSTSQNNLTDNSGGWKYYTANVGAGMSSLVVEMSGGTGDADLYVRQGSQPTTSSYNCRPYKTGNSETCTVNNPAADTWHIGIRAYSNYSGVGYTATWQ